MPSTTPARCAIAVCAAIGMLTAGASLAQAGEREFYVPGHTIECAVSDTTWHGAMCQSQRTMHYALLSTRGHVKVCSGSKCPYSDAGEGTPTLGVGKTLRVGRFSCTAKAGAIRCVVLASGHGFQMTSTGAKAVSAASG
jgi:hypothetical protein